MATDGAVPSTTSAGDDPVLAGALSEMASEGAALDQPFSPAASDGTASQPSDGASALTSAAPTSSAGDRGSVSDAARSAPAAPTPDASAATAIPEPAADPLAGTEPFTYGDGRKLDWAHRVPGEGVLLTEAEVPQLQQLAERAERLDRATRDLTTRHSDLERLTTWDIPSEDGKTTQQVTGAAAIEARDVLIARQDAVISLLDEILNDPQQFARLVAVNDKNEIVTDPLAVDYLRKDVLLKAHDAEQSARARFQQRGAPPAPSAASTTPPDVSKIDFQSAAPAVISEAAGKDAGILTAEDRTFLTEQLPQYIRTVTEQDRQADPLLKVGAPIVSERFTKVVQRQIALRTEATKAAQAAESAGKHNAGMGKGRQPAKQPPKPSTPAATPAAAPARTKPDWDAPLTSALSEMGIAR